MPIKKGSLIIPGNVDLSKVRVTEFQKRYPEQLNRYIRILEENPDDHLGIILLKPSSDGYFEILDGHHRYLAYIMMGRAVAFANIIEERYIHDPRWNDPSFVQGVRNELAAQAGIDANSPDRSHLRAEKERWTAQAVALEDIFTAFYAGSEKKRTNLFEKHTSLFVALQNAEPLFKTQE